LRLERDDGFFDRPLLSDRLSFDGEAGLGMENRSMYLTQGLKRAALIRGSATATVCSDRRRTWREVASRVSRLATVLRDLGMGPGDRVAVLALNSDRYLELFFGAPWSGGLIVPMNTRWAVAEMVHALNDSGAVVLGIDGIHAPLLPELLERCPSVRRVLYLGEGPPPAEECGVPVVEFEAAVAEASPRPDALRGYDDLAGLFYTSGTTGKSKGVMLTHANLFSNALTIVGYMNLREETVYLHCMPMFHVSGVARVYSITLAAGTHVIAPRFDAGEILETLERERVSVSVFVPTMLNMMLGRPDFDSFDLTRLHDIAYGASPMPKALIRRTMEKIPTARFTQAYGMTELSPVVTALLPEHHILDGPGSERIRSAGRPVIGAEIRIVDEEGSDVATGEIGQVLARGPMVMKGYWNLPELTGETLRDGWMHTGDAGYMDEAGFLFIVDRVKDMIVSGGENVYSAEVEDALCQHPAVGECAVIGIPDEKWVEAVHAVVVLRPGAAATESELIEHCRGLIARYKCPRSVEFRAEALPLSGSNKVLKTELRRPYWEAARAE
jgi:acyl-CoA synthetase (AMP-forming)/AMP-acid ligase II